MAFKAELAIRFAVGLSGKTGWVEEGSGCPLAYKDSIPSTVRPLTVRGQA